MRVLKILPTRDFY